MTKTISSAERETLKRCARIIKIEAGKFEIASEGRYALLAVAERIQHGVSIEKPLTIMARGSKRK